LQRARYALGGSWEPTGRAPACAAGPDWMQPSAIKCDSPAAEAGARVGSRRARLQAVQPGGITKRRPSDQRACTDYPWRNYRRSKRRLPLRKRAQIQEVSSADAGTNPAAYCIAPLKIPLGPPASATPPTDLGKSLERETLVSVDVDGPRISMELE
jgi:hypothetical protein